MLWTKLTNIIKLWPFDKMDIGRIEYDYYERLCDKMWNMEWKLPPSLVWLDGQPVPPSDDCPTCGKSGWLLD